MTTALADRLKALLLEEPGADLSPIDIDMAAMLRPRFGPHYDVASQSTERVLDAVRGADLAPLARHSPGLKGYDWTQYLRCSITRIVYVLEALGRHVPPGGRVLDLGSYFGNFAIATQRLGFTAEAIDAYREYADALAPCVALMRAEGVRVHDFEQAGQGLTQLDAGGYDAIVCAGVVEHIPHTPRQLLEAAVRCLRPGGHLVLDTPNLAYLYRRLQLLQGESIFSPLAGQYYTELPFEGHHREFTTAEVDWMIGAAGLELLSRETFNYSVYSQPQLTGQWALFQRMADADPELREIIIAVGRKPNA